MSHLSEFGVVELEGASLSPQREKETLRLGSWQTVRRQGRCPLKLYSTHPSQKAPQLKSTTTKREKNIREFFKGHKNT